MLNISTFDHHDGINDDNTDADANVDADCDNDALALLARYAVAGCPCDVLGRAAADQRYKLGSVQAVFGCDPIHAMQELVALPGMMYASQIATLTVVTLADAHRIDRLVQLVHGHQKHPVVNICQVPQPRAGIADAASQEWWMVFEDAHVIVHCRRIQALCADTSTSTNTDSIIAHSNEEKPLTDRKRQRSPVDFNDVSFVLYLYTFRRLVDEGRNNSILIIPEATPHDTVRLLLTTQLDLPVVTLSSDGLESTTSILARLVIQPKESCEQLQAVIDTASGTSVDETIILATERTNGIDPGLLVRAQQQTHAWREHCQTPSLRQHFPFKVPSSSVETSAIGIDSTKVHRPPAINASRTDLKTSFRLTTGCSIVFDIHKNQSERLFKVTYLNRNKQRERFSTASKMPQCGVTSDRHLWPRQLSKFLTATTGSDGLDDADRVSMHALDENEIDLEDEIEHDRGFQSPNGLFDCALATKPVQQRSFLLVLGTGCASPSPYRGASGYALVLPLILSNEQLKNKAHLARDELVVAVDVGEGFCTQWNRYACGRSLTEISLIWISHAHWDHYGGLANLLVRIRSAAQEPQRAHRPKHRHPPVTSSGPNKPPPWVVATAKVIKYLTLVLGESHDYFRPIRIDDHSAMSRATANLNVNSGHPLVFWENVKVDHSCQAFGFIVGLRRAGSPPYIFCYSGDTRPCWELVRACRQLAQKHSGAVDFLLHEATFDKDQADMSLTKKHSTIPEAITVGRDMDARRLLLTHFSQRYDTVPDVASESCRFDGRMQVGFALDGTTVELF